MEVIKLQLQINDGFINYKVLDQNDRYRKETYFYSSNGITIQSCNCPELEIYTIFIRGDRPSKDNRIDTLDCEDNESAIEAKSRFLVTLNEWKNSINPDLEMLVDGSIIEF